VQDDSDDPNPTLAREFQGIVDALSEITAGVEGLLTSRSRREAPTRELELILDGVDAITANVWAALAALDVAAGETAPDVFPAEWCEGE
jgi:hypothetical protein